MLLLDRLTLHLHFTDRETEAGGGGMAEVESAMTSLYPGMWTLPASLEFLSRAGLIAPASGEDPGWVSSGLSHSRPGPLSGPAAPVAYMVR